MSAPRRLELVDLAAGVRHRLDQAAKFQSSYVMLPVAWVEELLGAALMSTPDAAADAAPATLLGLRLRVDPGMPADVVAVIVRDHDQAGALRDRLVRLGVVRGAAL